jgi:hypothetical protein
MRVNYPSEDPLGSRSVSTPSATAIECASAGSVAALLGRRSAASETAPLGRGNAGSETACRGHGNAGSEAARWGHGSFASKSPHSGYVSAGSGATLLGGGSSAGGVAVVTASITGDAAVREGQSGVAVLRAEAPTPLASGASQCH